MTAAMAGAGRRLTWTTPVDETLLERVGWDELALRRIRRHLMRRFDHLPYMARTRLLEGGTHSRFFFLNLILQEAMTPESWQRWVTYLEHSEQDLAEMGRGEYPISPYMIRIYSAAFGIKVDFLLIGMSPTAAPEGIQIDIWPMVAR